MATTVQICYGDMSIGNAAAKVALAVITPNSKLKGLPSKSWSSKAPMAKSSAHTSIMGCGEWRTHSLQAEGISYLHLTCSSSSVHESGSVSNSVASIVVRVHEGGAVLSIHAKIPDVVGSTMIGGMVHAFQGRGDVLTPEEILSLRLNIPQKNLAPALVAARFRVLNYKVDADVRRTVTVKKNPEGKIVEQLVTERRRNVRIRRR